MQVKGWVSTLTLLVSCHAVTVFPGHTSVAADLVLLTWWSCDTREQFSWPNISSHIQNKWVIIFRLHSTAIWLMFSGGAPDGFRGPDVCLPCCNHPCSDTGVVSFHRSLNYPNYLSDCWYTIMLFKPGTVVFPPCSYTCSIFHWLYMTYCCVHLDVFTLIIPTQSNLSPVSQRTSLFTLFMTIIHWLFFSDAVC